MVCYIERKLEITGDYIYIITGLIPWEVPDDFFARICYGCSPSAVSVSNNNKSVLGILLDV